jgi:pimeloyl-ACP methyl ester carboxylesterase
MEMTDQVLTHESVATDATDAPTSYRRAEAAMWAEHGAPGPRERWVEVAAAGTRVRVLEHGQGRPVLFVHGGPNAASTWAPIVGRLSGFRALALDRPGCGLSESLPSAGDGSRIWDAMVEVQAAVIEALGGGSVDVVGSSFGGGCALSLAASRPDLVRRLVIEGVPTVEGMRIAPNLRILAAGPIGRSIARRPASQAVLRRTFRQLGHRRLVDSGWPSGADLAWGLSMMNDTPTMRNEVALIQSAATWRGFRTGRLVPADILGRIAAPTLWLWGDADPFGSPEVGEAWARRMPTATFEVLEASGHLPWLDDPAGHAKRIGTFLRER